MTFEREFVAEHRAELLADLDQWLRIPGISAQPEHHARRRAQRGVVRRRGRAQPASRPSRSGRPEGCPRCSPSGAATIATRRPSLVYGHHDVQPVDPIELWHTDPFDPTVDGDVLRARGASDDKGQLLFHLLGLRAHLAAAGRTSPAVNLKLLIEGEEESGSPHFEELLARAAAIAWTATSSSSPTPA